MLGDVFVVFIHIGYPSIQACQKERRKKQQEKAWKSFSSESQDTQF